MLSPVSQRDTPLRAGISQVTGPGHALSARSM